MARAAIQRGLRPILAGRKTAALQKIADELSLTKQEIQAHFFIVNAGKIPCKWLTPATLRFMTACVILPLKHSPSPASLVMHEACLNLFLHRYNFERALLLR